MERLTRKVPVGWDVVEGCKLDTKDGARAVVYRLAAYEETGLDPAEAKGAAEFLAKYQTTSMEEAIRRAITGGSLIPLVGRSGDHTKALRPCKGTYWHEGKAHDVVGWFHGWGSNYEEFESGPGNFTTALIEGKDGQVYECKVSSVRFLDGIESEEKE